MSQTPDEEVEAALKRVLRAQRRVHSLCLLHRLVKGELQAADASYTVSRDRLRRLALSRKLCKVEIEARDDTDDDFPGDCPACGSSMKNVKNETLYGWEVTLQRKCTVCPYYSGTHRRVPTLYVFTRD
jgi:hypothetical protein